MGKQNPPQVQQKLNNQLWIRLQLAHAPCSCGRSSLSSSLRGTSRRGPYRTVLRVPAAISRYSEDREMPDKGSFSAMLYVSLGISGTAENSLGFHACQFVSLVNAKPMTPRIRQLTALRLALT
jgi:hypothetical protein